MKFDEIINRRGTYCTQWDYIEDRFGPGTKDYTPFSISDTDFKCPDEILEMIVERTKHGIFGYSRWNHEDFKGSVANWYKKRFDTYIDPEWVVYSPNVIYTISSLFKYYLKDGGKIITHTPKYDGFSKILKPYEVVQITLTEENGIYKTNFLDMEEKMKTNDIKVFLLCNPENPTGKVWSEEELKKIVELCNKYDILIISDDIHMDITRKAFIPILKLDTTRSIIVTSASKTFNTPSLGGSYAIIPISDCRTTFVTNLKEVDSLSSPTIFGVLSTITAYDKCEYWVDELNEYITKNCNFVVNELNGFKNIKVFIPEATYLMWIDFSECGIDMEIFKRKLLDIGHVAIMSGDLYGDPLKLRLNVGCPLSKVKIATDAIKTILANM